MAPLPKITPLPSASAFFRSIIHFPNPNSFNQLYSRDNILIRNTAIHIFSHVLQAYMNNDPSLFSSAAELWERLSPFVIARTRYNLSLEDIHPSPPPTPYTPEEIQEELHPDASFDASFAGIFRIRCRDRYWRQSDNTWVSNKENPSTFLKNTASLIVLGLRASSNLPLLPPSPSTPEVAILPTQSRFDSYIISNGQYLNGLLEWGPESYSFPNKVASVLVDHIRRYSLYPNQN